MPAVILANIKGYHNIPPFLPFIFLKIHHTDLCVILILEDEIRPKLMLMGKISAKPLYLQSMIYLKRHHLNSALAQYLFSYLLCMTLLTCHVSRGTAQVTGQHAIPPLIWAKVCKPLQNFLGKVVTSADLNSVSCHLSLLGREAVAGSCWLL